MWVTPPASLIVPLPLASLSLSAQAVSSAFCLAQAAQPSPDVSLLPPAMPSESKAGSGHTVILGPAEARGCFAPSLTLLFSPCPHRRAGRPLREEHPETCPHLPPFPSGLADVAQHRQG